MKKIILYLFFVICLLTIAIPIKAYGYTDEDVRLLAAAMTLENGSTGRTEEENTEILILTGAVILNRAKDGNWGGSTVRDVLFARLPAQQYASSTINNLNTVKIPKKIMKLAKDLVKYGSNVPDYVIYQGQNPHNGTLWKSYTKVSAKGEHFGTSGGHYKEGQDLAIKINYPEKNKIAKTIVKAVKSVFKKHKKIFDKIKNL